MGSDNKCMDGAADRMSYEGKIDLMKATIGQKKEHLMVKAGSPNKSIGTRAYPKFDIRRVDGEIRSGIDTI